MAQSICTLPKCNFQVKNMLEGQSESFVTSCSGHAVVPNGENVIWSIAMDYLALDSRHRSISDVACDHIHMSRRSSLYSLDMSGSATPSTTLMKFDPRTY